MTYKLAQWLSDRGTILVNALCGIVSPEWFENEIAFRMQILRDHLELEEMRESDGMGFVCDACSPVNRPN
jgi:hypothetical protein